MEVNQKFGEVTFHHKVGVRNRAGPSQPAQPSVLADLGSPHLPAAARSHDPDNRPTAPRFAAPGLVLVAALAIFTGYDWLHLFRGASFRPPAR